MQENKRTFRSKNFKNGKNTFLKLQYAFIIYKGIKSLPQTQIFQMFISLQPDGVHLWFFKLRLFDLKEVLIF